MTQENNPNIIQVKNLTTAYGSTVIHEDISFEVSRGQIFVILGGSGCGKSTLMKHMIGLYRPVKGQILIDNIDIVQANAHVMRELYRKFGVMYQGGALFGSMTVLQNVRLVLEEFTRLPTAAMNALAAMKLAMVGLADAANKLPSELSGGMQKRAAISRAMALDPDIIFLDEPSAGLDPITSADLDQLIRSLSRELGITFVIVSHELASIYSIADHVIMLDKMTRKIIASGDPKTLRETASEPWVRAFFNRQTSATISDNQEETT